MSPKKAIIIVLILFLIMAMVFVFLYLQQQLAGPADKLINQAELNKAGGPGQAEQPAKPAEIIEQKVEKIIEDAKQNPTASSPDTVRQEIISTINAEIIKQEQNKTPEQKAADLKAQQERQKIIDQINSQIRQAN